MTSNTYLSTIESKNKIKNRQNSNRIIDTETVLVVARWERVWGIGKESKGTKVQTSSYRLVVGM